MKPLLIYLTYSIVLISIILVVIFGYLIAQRLKEQRQTKKINHYLLQYLNDFYLYIVEGTEQSDQLIPDSSIKIQAIETILIQYAKNIQGDSISKRISLFAEWYLCDYYKKQLQSRKWQNRMNALNKIIDFHMEILLDEVLAMIDRDKKYSKEEYLRMYSIVILFKNERYFECMKYPKYELGEFDYKRILHLLDPDQFEFLLYQYDPFHPNLKNSLLDMIGQKHFLQFIPYLERHLNDESTEVRIRALKALSQFGFIQNLHPIIPFVHSLHWEERMMTAKILAYDDSSQTLHLLRELLHDPSLWVRSQAAKSIRMRKYGEDILQTTLSSSPDQFMIEVAKEALEEVR